MTVYSLILGVTIAANLWLAVFVGLRSNRQLPRTALVAFLALSAASHAIAVGRTEGVMSASWDATGLGAYILAHAAVAAFAILFLHGEPLRARMPTLLAIVGPGVGLTVLGGAVGWRSVDTFQPSTDLGLVALNAYLVACLAVALAESFAAWRRSATYREESFYLLAGIVALIVAGPIYSFELVVLGITEFLGTNPLAPVAGAMFALALLRSSPIRFRGQAPEPDVRVPWELPAGAFLVEETRPKYAEAMALSVKDRPVLAIVCEPTSHLVHLAGLETACLPPGARSASVLASTAAEFFARNRDGTVLVDDLSYVVCNAGIDAAREGIARVLHGMPATARLIVSLSKLTPREREELASLPATRLSPPDFENELARVLNAHLGASSDQLQRAALARGKRVEGLAVVDLPDLRDFWLASLADLRSPADEAAQSGWRRVSESLAAGLETLWRTPPTEPRPAERVARAAPTREKPQPAPDRPPSDGFTLVRATEVLATTSGGSAPESPPSAPLGPAVREAFLGSLGPAGEAVYRRVINGLRKEPTALRPEDLPHVVRLAEEAISDLGGAIDVDSAKRDLLERTHRLRLRLEGLARETR